MLEVCVNIVVSVNDRRRYACVIQVHQDSTDGIINGKTRYVINLYFYRTIWRAELIGK